MIEKDDLIMTSKISILEIPTCPSVVCPHYDCHAHSCGAPQFIGNKYVVHFQVSVDRYKIPLDYL